MKIVELLDASVARASRVAAPWMGVLWLAVLPARLLFVYLLQEITRLDHPHEYSRYLIRIALLQFAAELLALYGRAAYVRACYMNDDPEHGAGWAPLRVPFSDLLTYLYVSFILSFMYYASLMSFIGPACILVLSGLAAASSYGLGKDGLFGSFISVFGLLRHFLPVLAISLLFAFSLFLANINVLVLINILLFLSAPLLGPSLPRWEHIFEATKPIGAFAQHPLTFSLIAMLAAMVVEPFWLAANLEFVQRVRARKTGDDLRQWFNDLRKNELGTQPVRLNRKSTQIAGAAQKATLVMVLFLSTFSFACGSEISVEEYREKLNGINAALDAKDLPRAQREAKAIDSATVSERGGHFKVDSSILQPLVSAKDLKSAEPLRARVRALADALSQTSPISREAHSVQSDLIEQIRKDQEVPLPPKDGEMEDYGVSKWSIWKWIGDRIVEFFTWIGNKWDAFWKWIGSLFPTPPPGALNALPEVVTWGGHRSGRGRACGRRPHDHAQSQGEAYRDCWIVVAGGTGTRRQSAFARRSFRMGTVCGASREVRPLPRGNSRLVSRRAGDALPFRNSALSQRPHELGVLFRAAAVAERPRTLSRSDPCI